MSVISRLILVAIAASALVLGGCKGSCRQLAEKLCECESNTVEKEQCLREVSAQEQFTEPTAEDEAFCESKLEVCDCHLIDTAQGKKDCGLAR